MSTKIEPLYQWIRSNDPAVSEAMLRSHGTSLAYVKQIAYGNKQPSAAKAVAIERATGVSRRLLRPSDWQIIWPEARSAA